jgi:hypothetical protein
MIFSEVPSPTLLDPDLMEPWNLDAPYSKDVSRGGVIEDDVRNCQLPNG